MIEGGASREGEKHSEMVSWVRYDANAHLK